MTKYPIILVHGIVIKNFKHFRAFGKIEKELRQKGFIVYSSNIDGFGTIETNAQMLKEEILDILKKENVDKVNIIAHSKGGLDSKYMIENLGMEENVATLTTLCTPHRGSIVASLIMKWPRWLTKFIAFWIDFWYRIFGDKHPNSHRVCEQLQKKMDYEWLELDVHHKIYYQSFSSKIDDKIEDFVMGIPYLISRKYEEDETDGLVSKSSAMFGHYKGSIEGSISHSEIVDFMTSKSKKEQVYGFYIELCTDLKQRGF